jgi:hypothetical protein
MDRAVANPGPEIQHPYSLYATDEGVLEMAKHQYGAPAEEPTPAHAKKVPEDVIRASEAFRLRRDAARYRFLRARPRLGRVLQYQKHEDIDNWVDAQMRAAGEL